MKVPKEIKLYCKKCKKHTTHTLKQFKEGPKSALKKHTRKHEVKHVKGYGGKARHPIHTKKQGKKPTFVATCSVCNSKTYYVAGNKAKKKPELL